MKKTISLLIVFVFIAGVSEAALLSISQKENIEGLWIFPGHHTILEITEDKVTRYGSNDFYEYKLLDDHRMWQRHGEVEQTIRYNLSDDGGILMMEGADEEQYFGEKIEAYFLNTDFAGKYVPDIQKTNIAYIEILDESNALFGNDFTEGTTPMKYVLTEGKFFLIGCCKYWVFEINDDGLSMRGHHGEDWGIFKKVEEIELAQAAITDIPLPNIKIYPNPTPRSFIVDYDSRSQIKIYDINGREMLTQTANGKTEIDISHLPKGVYIVNVFSDDKVVGSSKIVKQ